MRKTTSPRFLRRHDYLSFATLPGKESGSALLAFFNLWSKERLASNDQGFHRTQRMLGGGKSDHSSSGAGFGIFAIVIFTLGLILVVESILHRLDHYAKGREFFREILSTCYRECK